MNTSLVNSIQKILSPTLDYHEGPIGKTPVSLPESQRVNELAESNISLSKTDWDSYEVSWDFTDFPLIRYHAPDAILAQTYESWKTECNEHFYQLKANEEELNRIFAEIYHMEDEVPIEVPLDKVSVHIVFDSEDDVPDELKGGSFVRTKADEEFVADSLGGAGTPRQAIRTYFRDGFFADHCKTYSVQSAGKRPIYWLFDSGKKGGFRALFYMHRYTPDLLARLRTEYVLPQQDRYRTQIDVIDDAMATADRREAADLRKRRKKLADQLAETVAYEEKVHHLADQMIEIDLDDGVKHNYALFQDVLAKIK